MASPNAKVKKKVSPEEKSAPVVEKQPEVKRPARNRTVKVKVTAPVVVPEVAAVDVAADTKEVVVVPAKKEETNPKVKAKGKAREKSKKVSAPAAVAETASPVVIEEKPAEPVLAAESESAGTVKTADAVDVKVSVDIAETPAETSSSEGKIATIEVISEPPQPEPEAEPDKVPQPESPAAAKSDKAEADKADKPEASPVLTAETQDVFTRLREAVGFPVLAYWTSTTGSICQNDVMAMSHLLAETPKSETVGLFLKSDGGNPEAALRLVHLLRSTFKSIVLFAPFECASAATMVALGSNEVHMGRTSYLTAVDTSLKHQLSPVDHGNDLVSVSQDEVSRILRLWKDQKTTDNPYPEVYKYLHPLVIGALDRSSSLSIRICAELLSYHLEDKERSEQISRELNSSYPSHSYPITASEARRLGLNVKDLDPTVEKLLRDLNMQYSTMAHPLITDYDEGHYHINEICNILEINGRQIFYSVNKDWYYRKEERRWSPMKDKSSWKSVTKVQDAWVPATFFIR